MANSGGMLRLSGGTLFTLMVRAMKRHGRNRGNYGQKGGGITQANMLKDLLKVYNPSTPDQSLQTEKGNATSFKQGKNLGVVFPVNEPVARKQFNDAVCSRYNSRLKPMEALVEKYLDTETYKEWLVKAILQLIDEDGEIADDALFYVTEKPVEKRNINSLAEYNLPAFLLGVWHYICMNVQNNTVGAQTFQLWYPDGAEGEFVSSIGMKAEKHIIVTDRANPADDQVVEWDEPDQDVLSERYADYLSEMHRKYSKVKTILHEELKPFRDSYVCNGLQRKLGLGATPGSFEAVRNRYIDTPTVDLLQHQSNFIIIVGTGGLGKSMMMQHLMLDTIERCDELGFIPIFIQLKDYTSSNLEISEFVYSQFHGRYPGLEREQFNRDLTNGKYVLLFDGLDEINPSYRGQFETRFDMFADANAHNMMIISSRPFSDFLNLKRFAVMHLMPLTLEKATELIEKLEFREDDPSFKENFKQDLRRLYDTHRPFVQNPLLLTFMLMTYERSGPVSIEMHSFYSEVYDLLATRHDNSKSGYNRTMKSGLSPERLKLLFAAFCSNTYQENRLSFTYDELMACFEEVIPLLNEDEQGVKPSALIDDYTDAICLLYRDGGKYHFMHRSFQEYFCAYSFWRQTEEFYPGIADFFENSEGRDKYTRYGDKTFEMLYEMAPSKVEKCIIIPFLEQLFAECDSKKGYLTYLNRVRPVLRYDVGEVDGITISHPASFIYSFITSHYKIEQDIFSYRGTLPVYDEFITSRYIEVQFDGEDEDEENISVIDVETLPNSERDDVDIVGWTICAYVDDIYEEPEEYERLIKAVESESFPYKIEYNAARDLLQKLKDQVAQRKKRRVATL